MNPFYDILFKEKTFQIGVRKDHDGVYFIAKNPRTGKWIYPTDSIITKEDAEHQLNSLVIMLYEEEQIKG